MPDSICLMSYDNFVAVFKYRFQLKPAVNGSDVIWFVVDVDG